VCFGKYFDAYEWIVFDRHDATVIPACQIYNADESGFTVCYKPGRVLAQKVSSSSNQPQKRQNKDVQVVTAVKKHGKCMACSIFFNQRQSKKQKLKI